MTKAGIVDWEQAWNLTPRQLAALLFIDEKHDSKERAKALMLHVLAARGASKDVKKQLREWAS